MGNRTGKLRSKSDADSEASASTTASTAPSKSKVPRRKKEKTTSDEALTGGKPIAHPIGPSFLAEWFQHRLITVPESNRDIEKDLLLLGMKVRFVERSSNPHAFSAACREYATQTVLMRAGRGTRELKVLDLFGSARTRIFDPSCNAPFVRLSDNTPSRDLKIEIIAAPDTPIAGDSARGDNVRIPFQETTGRFDVVLAIDIYQSGSDHRTEFSEEFASEIICKYSKDSTMYWIGRRFTGLAGADDPIGGTNDTDKYVEQVFIRDQDDMILSSPDRVSGNYSPHPSPEWMFSRASGALDIAIKQVVGPYYIICISVGKYNRIPIAPMPQPEGECTTVRIPVAKRHWLFRSFLGSVETETTFMVHWPTLSALSPRVIGKMPSGQLYDIVGTNVTNEFSKIVWLKELKRRYPRFHFRLVKQTILATMYYDRDDSATIISGLREMHTYSEWDLSRGRQVSNPFNVPSPLIIIVIKISLGLSVLFVFFSAVVYYEFHILIFDWFPYFLLPCVALIGSLHERTRERFDTMINKTIGKVMSMIKKYRHSKTGAWILPCAPVVSAVLEESLAIFFPRVAVFGALCEFVVREGKTSSTLMMHFVCQMLRLCGWEGRLLALVIHVGWNDVLSTDESPSFRMFYENYKEGVVHRATTSTIEEIDEFTILPSFTTRFSVGPEHFRGTIRILVDGSAVSIGEAFEQLGRPEGPNHTFPILITNRLLHQPSRTDTNLLAAVLLRTHADPFRESTDNKNERHARWNDLSEIIIKLFPRLHDKHFTVDDNINLMGKKGQRLFRAYHSDVVGHTQNVGKTINLKWNETISANKQVLGMVSMKPRAIQNLPPLVHANMGGFSRSFNHTLHELFDGRVLNIAGYAVRIFYASGYTQSQLSEIATAIVEGDTVVAVSGDDSIVSWGPLCSQFGGESDQSAFDHTQDEGPMLIFMRPVLLHLGFPVSFIDEAYAACSSGYTLKGKRLFAKGCAGVQMPTGITTTTSFNSLSTICMYVWLFVNFSRLEGDVAHAGKELGFTVKYAEAENINTLTFLKGWFQFDGFNYQWMPLPSAIIKLGKVLRSPIEITGYRNKHGKQKFESKKAIRMCAYALAQSYGTVDKDYPILGAFIHTLKRLGTEPHHYLGELQESWKPSLSGIRVERQAVFESIYARYGIEPDEINSFELLLESVQSLPAYIEHPVCDKLCDIDY
jgi:hypothetical protein